MSCESLDILPELAVSDDVPLQDLVGVRIDAWGAEDGAVRILSSGLLQYSQVGAI